MGIRDKPIAPASPSQKGYAERLIGSIRRGCLEHVIVLGEAHLRRILRAYADYYNCIRTYRSLNKDVPISHPIQRVGPVAARPILAELHHHHARSKVSAHKATLDTASSAGAPMDPASPMPLIPSVLVSARARIRFPACAWRAACNSP